MPHPVLTPQLNLGKVGRVITTLHLFASVLSMNFCACNPWFSDKSILEASLEIP